MARRRKLTQAQLDAAQPEAITTAIRGAFNSWNREKSELVKRVALQALSDAQTASPVSFGFYRASHSLTIGTVPSGTYQPISAAEKKNADPEEYKRQNAAEAERKMQAAFAEVSPIELTGARQLVIVLSTNLVYSRSIELGSSQQAPEGVYSQVRANAAANLAAGLAAIRKRRLAAGKRRR